jgi:hypothetical protein
MVTSYIGLMVRARIGCENPLTQQRRGFLIIQLHGFEHAPHAGLPQRVELDPRSDRSWLHPPRTGRRIG